MMVYEVLNNELTSGSVNNRRRCSLQCIARGIDEGLDTNAVESLFVLRLMGSRTIWKQVHAFLEVGTKLIY